MVRFGMVLLLALGALLLTPQAAAGGGWASWIHVSRSTVAPGQLVEVEAEAWFRSAATAEAAQSPGRFYVYLLRDFDYAIVKRAWSSAAPGDWWSLGGAEAIRVGQVTVTVPQASNLGRARAEFAMPELPSATYHLMLCDAGCAEPLATVIPAKGFRVVADPVTAELAQRVDLLERRIREQARELSAARVVAKQARGEARSVAELSEQLDARISSLTKDVQRSAATALISGGGLVAAALAGALILHVVRRRRTRALRPGDLGAAEVRDEELRELISLESGRSS